LFCGRRDSYEGEWEAYATFCFFYISTLADVVSLKTLMNHSNIQQTSEYVATNDELLKKAVRLG